MSTQVGSTTESGVTEDAGCLVPMHFKVLGQRSKMLVNTSTETARKTPWTLHHHLTSCIANMLPFPSHPPCNTSTVSWPRFLITLILIKWGVQKKSNFKASRVLLPLSSIKLNPIKLNSGSTLNFKLRILKFIRWRNWWKSYLNLFDEIKLIKNFWSWLLTSGQINRLEKFLILKEI